MDREQPSSIEKKKESRLELAPPAELPSSGNGVLRRIEKAEKMAQAKKLQYAEPFETEDGSEAGGTVKDDCNQKEQKGEKRLAYAPPFEEEKMEIQETDVRVLPGAYPIPGISSTTGGNETTSNNFSDEREEENNQDDSNLPVRAHAELVNEDYPEGKVLDLQQLVMDLVKKRDKRVYIIIILILVAVICGMSIYGSIQPTTPSPSFSPTTSSIPTTTPSPSLFPTTTPSSVPGWGSGWIRGPQGKTCAYTCDAHDSFSGSYSCSSERLNAVNTPERFIAANNAIKLVGKSEPINCYRGFFSVTTNSPHIHEGRNDGRNDECYYRTDGGANCYDSYYAGANLCCCLRDGDSPESSCPIL